MAEADASRSRVLRNRIPLWAFCLAMVQPGLASAVVCNVFDWGECGENAGELRGGPCGWNAYADDAGSAGLVLHEHRGEPHRLRISVVLSGHGTSFQRDSLGLRSKESASRG